MKNRAIQCTRRPAWQKEPAVSSLLSLLSLLSSRFAGLQAVLTACALAACLVPEALHSEGNADQIRIAPTMSLNGSTSTSPSQPAPARIVDRAGQRIQSRSMALGLQVTGEDATPASGFEYSLHTEIRVETTLYSEAGQPQGRSAVVVPFGPTRAGMLLSPFARIVFGYVPDEHGTLAGADATPETDAASFDLWLRRSVYPGLHLQLKVPGLFTLHLSPLLLLDSPGRLAPESTPFFSVARDATIVRFREGAISSAVAPDRLARQADIHFDLDGWMVGASIRTAFLRNTGSSDASQMLLQQNGIEAGYRHAQTGGSVHVAAALVQSQGYVRGTGTQRSIEATQGILHAGWRGPRLLASTFAMQTQPTRRRRGDGEDAADRLGWIDTGASPMDLPILGGETGALPYAIPCVPAQPDRCDGLVQSALPDAFRHAGRYGDLTLGVRGGPWRFAGRAGILVPTADVMPVLPLARPEPYADITELAVELALSSAAGTLVLVYSAQYTRTGDDRHRSLHGQSLSAFARFPVSLDMRQDPAPPAPAPSVSR